MNKHLRSIEEKYTFRRKEIKDKKIERNTQSLNN